MNTNETSIIITLDGTGPTGNAQTDWATQFMPDAWPRYPVAVVRTQAVLTMDVASSVSDFVVALSRAGNNRPTTDIIPVLVHQGNFRTPGAIGPSWYVPLPPPAANTVRAMCMLGLDSIVNGMREATAWVNVDGADGRGLAAGTTVEVA